MVEKPISSMEKLEEGIAEFENAIKLCEGAGGEIYNDESKKMDLLNVLPGDLGIDLIWEAEDPLGGFAGPENHVAASRL